VIPVLNYSYMVKSVPSDTLNFPAGRAVLLLFLAIIWGGVPSVSPQAAAEEPEKELTGILTSVKGEVSLRTNSTAEWEPAVKGMMCRESAEIRTGKTGSAELMFVDGTAIRIEKNSTIRLERIQRQKGFRDILIDLLNGRLLSNVKRHHKRTTSKYTVKTLAAVISVRGTVFAMDHSKKITECAVYEGVVEAESLKPKRKRGQTDKPVRINQNQQTRIKAGRAPLPPHPLTEEFEAYQKATADLFNRRIEAYRKDMDAVRRMYEDYMQRKSDENKKKMEDRRKGYRELMEKRRKSRQQFEKDKIEDYKSQRKEFEKDNHRR